MKVEVKTNEYSYNNLCYPVFRLFQAPIFYVLISNMSFSYCIWPFESTIQLNIKRLTSSSTLDIQLHLDDGSVIECPHNVVVRIKPGNDGISLSWCINNPCVTPVSGLSNFWWYRWLLMTALISKLTAIKIWIKSSNLTSLKETHKGYILVKPCHALRNALWCHLAFGVSSSVSSCALYRIPNHQTFSLE